MPTIEQKLKYLENRIVAANEKISNFKNELDKDPAYAFDWSTEVVRAAAYVRLASQIQSHLKNSPTEETLDRVMNSLREDLARNAGLPQFSTSPMSNLVSQFTNAARAELLELLK